MTPADFIAGLFIALFIAVLIDLLAPRERRREAWDKAAIRNVEETSK